VSFLLIIVVFFAIGIVTTNSLIALGDVTRTIYNHPLVVSNASLNSALNITKMHRSMKDVVLAVSLAERESARLLVADYEQVVFEQLDIIKENILGQEGQFLERQTRRIVEEWRPIRGEVIRLIGSGDKEKAVRITKGKGAVHVAKLEAKMLELTAYARNKATGFLMQAEQRQASIEQTTAIMTLIGVLLATAIAVFATHRVLKAEARLMDERNKLQTALDEIKTLRGIIPICSYCKQIQDDKGLWKQMEVYIRSHSEADFSHGICPKCLRKHFPEEYEDVMR
jgi:hypothetical protein